MHAGGYNSDFSDGDDDPQQILLPSNPIVPEPPTFQPRTGNLIPDLSLSDEGNDASPSLLIDMERGHKTIPTPVTMRSTPLNRQSATASILKETDNLDELLAKVLPFISNDQVYEYYTEKGFFCSLLSKAIDLIILAFIVLFSTFLFQCVDFPMLKQQQKHFYEIVKPMSCLTDHGWFMGLFSFLFWIWWGWQVLRYLSDISFLKKLEQFFVFGLMIPENELPTLTWSEVVSRIQQLASTYPTLGLEKLDAHTIAHRILRKENYMIALFNKEIMDLRIPYIGKRHLLTKIMEWNLWLCMATYVFGDNGQVKPMFLNERYRSFLIEGLKKRFMLMGILNIVFAPVLLFLLLLYSFFGYAEEIHRDPKSLSARDYSRFAWWKFREFNELPHFYQERLERSYEPANQYLSGFRNQAFILVAKFIAFISGSFAGVLALIAIMDQDLLMNFEITPGVTALFYIGLFGGIFAATRGLIPPNGPTLDPNLCLWNVIEETHYLPDEWRDKFHKDEVKASFSALYDYRLKLWAIELLSLIASPFILCFSLPQCSADIVDFFREFTVQTNVGYVCSFAEFDFKRHGNLKYGVPSGVREEKLVSKQGKMEQSFLTFKQNYPDWEPNIEGSQYYSSVMHVIPKRMPGSLWQRHAYNFTKPPPQEESMAQSGLFGLLDALYENNRKMF